MARPQVPRYPLISLKPQVLTGNLEARGADMRMTDGHSDRAFKSMRNGMIRASNLLPFT